MAAAQRRAFTCLCHVTGQDCTRVTPLFVFHVVSRIVLSVHFFAELVDKFENWDHWVEVIGSAGFPVPTFMLVLVVSLLLLGAPLLVAGVFLRWAAGVLLLFQLPTTIFFEVGNWYEQADSISVMGGLLLAVCVDETLREAKHVPSCRGCWRRRQPEDLHPLQPPPLAASADAQYEIQDPLLEEP